MLHEYVFTSNDHLVALQKFTKLDTIRHFNFQMDLQNFEMEYLHNKDLSYFEDYNTNHKSTPHVYVAEGLEEIQETLQELNLPVAMVYNAKTDKMER